MEFIFSSLRLPPICQSGLVKVICDINFLLKLFDVALRQIFTSMYLFAIFDNRSLVGAWISKASVLEFHFQSFLTNSWHHRHRGNSNVELWVRNRYLALYYFHAQYHCQLPSFNHQAFFFLLSGKKIPSCIVVGIHWCSPNTAQLTPSQPLPRQAHCFIS